MQAVKAHLAKRNISLYDLERELENQMEKKSFH